MTDHALITWLSCTAHVADHAFTFSPIGHEEMGPDAMILGFFDFEFQANFFTLLFHSHQEAL